MESSSLTSYYLSLLTVQVTVLTLIAVGILAAYFASILLTILGSEESYYEAAALLITFVLFGHWMEMKSRRGRKYHICGTWLSTG